MSAQLVSTAIPKFWLNCLQNFFENGEISEKDKENLNNFLSKLGDYEDSDLSCRERVAQDLKEKFSFNVSEIKRLVLLLLNETIDLDEMNILRNLLSCFLKEVKSLPYVY